MKIKRYYNQLILYFFVRYYFHYTNLLHFIHLRFFFFKLKSYSYVPKENNYLLKLLCIVVGLKNITLITWYL